MEPTGTETTNHNTNMKRITYIVEYGSSGIEKCKGVRALADFIHNLIIDYGPKITVKVSVEK